MPRRHRFFAACLFTLFVLMTIPDSACAAGKEYGTVGISTLPSRYQSYLAQYSGTYGIGNYVNGITLDSILVLQVSRTGDEDRVGVFRSGYSELGVGENSQQILMTAQPTKSIWPDYGSNSVNADGVASGIVYVDLILTRRGTLQFSWECTHKFYKESSGAVDKANRSFAVTEIKGDKFTATTGAEYPGTKEDGTADTGKGSYESSGYLEEGDHLQVYLTNKSGKYVSGSGAWYNPVKVNPKVANSTATLDNFVFTPYYQVTHGAVDSDKGTYTIGYKTKTETETVEVTVSAEGDSFTPLPFTTEYALAATPNDANGYMLDYWELTYENDPDNPVQLDSSTETFTIDKSTGSDVTVRAVFKEKPQEDLSTTFTLTNPIQGTFYIKDKDTDVVTALEGEWDSETGTGTTESLSAALTGKRYLLTAVPRQGYTLAGWSLGSKGTVQINSAVTATSNEGKYALQTTDENGDIIFTTEFAPAANGETVYPIFEKSKDVTVVAPTLTTINYNEMLDATKLRTVSVENGEWVTMRIPESHTLDFSYKIDPTLGVDYKFDGWYVNNSSKSTEITYTLSLTGSEPEYNVTANIVSKDGAVRYEVAGKPYPTWAKAMGASVSNGNAPVYIIKASNSDVFTLPTGNDIAEEDIGTYVLKDDATGRITYVIPSGTIFMIRNTISGTANSSTADQPYAMVDMLSASNASGDPATPGGTDTYFTLVVPNGVDIQIQNNAGLTLGGAMSGSGLCSTRGGATKADIKLEGDAKIDIQSGGRLSSCGVIYGAGKVIARSGASIYTPFGILDFKGGGHTVSVGGQAEDTSSPSFGIKTFPSGETAISPFFQHSMCSIQCDQTIYQGAYVYGYLNLYAGSQNNPATAQIIGTDSSKCILALTSSGGRVEVKYNTSEKYKNICRTEMTIYGDAGFGGLELKVNASVKTVTITTRKVTFPLPYNYDVKIMEGKLSVGNPLAVLPGAEVYVADGAELEIPSSSKLIVYDGLDDWTGLASQSGPAFTQITGFDSYYTACGISTSTHVNLKKQGFPYGYPTTADLKASSLKMNNDTANNGTANLVVDGTMTINGAFGGVVQTTGEVESARIDATNMTGTSVTAQTGGVGHCSINVIIVSKDYYLSGASVRTLDAEIMDNATGQRTKIQQGSTYRPSAASYTLKDYSYDVYVDSADTNHVIHFNSEAKAANADKANYGESTAINAPLTGSWWNLEKPVTLVTTGGETLATETKVKVAYGADFTGSTVEIALPFTTVTLGNLYQEQSLKNRVGTVSDESTMYAGVLDKNAPVWVITPEADGTTTNKGYLTLQAAVTAYGTAGTGAYIQLNPKADTSRIGGATLTKNTILDLNGCTISGTVTTDGHTLFGADSSSNQFTESAHTVTVDNPANVAAVGAIGGKHYVACGTGNAYSFNRVEITPTACRFYLNNSGHAHMAFEATIQGDNRVLANLVDLGFAISIGNELKSENWYQTDTNKKPALEDKGTVTFIALSYNKDKTNDPNADKQKLITDYNVKYSVTAKVAFGAKVENVYPVNVVVSSDGTHSISLQQALNDYLVGTKNGTITEEKTGDRDKIIEFFKNNSISLPADS